MKTHFVGILILMNYGMATAQWTGQTSSSDLTSPISRTGSLSLTGTGSFLTVTSRAGGGSNGNILFQNGTNQNLILAEMSANNWAIGYGLTAGSVPTPVISWSTTNNVAFAGSVGIGTTSPSFSLDVQGFGSRLKNTSNAFNTYTSFRVQGQDYANGLEIDFFGNNNVSSDPIYTYGGGPGSAALINVNAKPLVLGTNNQGKMIIDGAGNVGIGTTSPDAKLAVSGQVHAQEVKVSVAVPGPDYVFEKDYPLTSLEEIKNYIDQNKHLPEVPSAKEMEKNGIQLGEMNMLLLKKIEELTLYVIELKKENDEAKNRMKVMQLEIEQLK